MVDVDGFGEVFTRRIGNGFSGGRLEFGGDGAFEVLFVESGGADEGVEARVVEGVEDLFDFDAGVESAHGD